MPKQGAYVLYLDVPSPLHLKVGTLKDSLFPAGRYAYVGSALSGIEQRIARHRRLAVQKTGNLHWHVDYLLTHPKVRLIGDKAFPGARECEISRKISSGRGATVPVPRFGATDCSAGCEAHLYRIHSRMVLQNRSKTGTRKGSRVGLEARPHRQQ